MPRFIGVNRQIVSNDIQDGGVQPADLAASVTGALVPVGCIFATALPAAPAGYLLCDGNAVSRSTYAALFAAMGTTHGQGDGSTTFNLPDYRGRFLRGVDAGSGRDPQSGSRPAMNTGGNTNNNVGSVQLDAFQNITGTIEVQTRDGVYGEAVKNGTGALSAFNSPNNQGGSGTSLTAAGGFDRIDLNAANSAGARTSTETRPQNAYVNFIIKF